MTRKEAQVFWVVFLVVIIVGVVVVFLPSGGSSPAKEKPAAKSPEKAQPDEIKIVETSKPSDSKATKSVPVQSETNQTVKVTIPTFDATCPEMAEAKTADEIERSDHIAVVKPPQQPSAPPVSAAAPVGSVEITVGQSHVVSSGDSLARIARKYYGSEAPANIDRIVKANTTVLTKGAQSKLMPGMKLIIPDVQAEAAQSTVKPVADAGQVVVSAAAPAAPQAAPEAEEKIHVVAKGDTLAKISKQYLGSSSPDAIKKILQANPQIKNPNSLSIGDKLKIPAQ